jgi:hypothetical protein
MGLAWAARCGGGKGAAQLSRLVSSCRPPRAWIRSSIDWR